jgi:hypothetical protein
MILIRYILVSLIVYLVIRSFVRFTREEKPVTGRPDSEKMNKTEHKSVSKKVGEYVDYEEVGK